MNSLPGYDAWKLASPPEREAMSRVTKRQITIWLTYTEEEDRTPADSARFWLDRVLCIEAPLAKAEKDGTLDGYEWDAIVLDEAVER